MVIAAECLLTTRNELFHMSPDSGRLEKLEAAFVAACALLVEVWVVVWVLVRCCSRDKRWCV